MSAPQATPEQVATALATGLSLLFRRLKQSLREGELTLPERSALSRIDRGGPTTAAALAKLEQISPQSMGATLATLEQRGLVARAADPADGRRVILSLTAPGRAAIHAKRAARDALLTRVLASDFSAQEREQLLAAAPLIERLAQRI